MSGFRHKQALNLKALLSGMKTKNPGLVFLFSKQQKMPSLK